MFGKLLNRSGKPVGEMQMPGYGVSAADYVRDRLDHRLGEDEREGWEGILENLDKGWRYRLTGPRNSLQTWHETLYVTVADGTQVIASTTETILVPNFLLPTGYLYQGRWLRYTVYFDVSTVITTPGTVTHALRWNGVAGTALATSGAYVPDPTAALTTRSGYVVYDMVCRSVGATGTAFTMGRTAMGLHNNDTTALLATNLDTGLIPTNAPAAVTIDTTIANPPLSPTIKFSVTTATTQATAHMAILETLT